MLSKTINELSEIITISEKSKQYLISKYQDVSDKELIKGLSKLAYENLKEDDVLYTQALKIICNINQNICPSIDEMKMKLDDLYQNKPSTNVDLNKNHQMIINNLVYFTKLFNENNIDYYIVGILPNYLKLGIPLFRYHDDIDIMMNEKDVQKVTKLLEKCNYIFQDDRYPTLKRYHKISKNRPPHIVLAQSKENEFHLGFFIFRREKDNAITVYEYTHHLENNQVVVDILERHYDLIGTKLRYDDTIIKYLDTEFKTNTIESIYKLKSYTRRPKDITDMKKIKSFINKEKLALLEKHHSKEIIIKKLVS